MRRSLTLVLLLLFSLPLIAPLFASTSAHTLPICCRKDGTHHCMGMAAASQDAPSSASIGSRCPAYPFHAATAGTHPVLLVRASTLCSTLIAEPAAPTKPRPRPDTVSLRSHPKRGPPTLLS